MTREDALRKLQSLLRLSARAATPGEAAAAAARAQAVMDAHNLTAAALGEESGPEENPETFHNRPEGWLGIIPPRSSWHGRLAHAIGKMHGCMTFRWNGRAVNGRAVTTLEIAGRPSDVETVRYLYTWLAGEIQRLTDAHGRGMGVTWRASFALGAVETIAERLKAQREETAREVVANVPESHRSDALVRVDNALAKTQADTLAAKLATGLRFTRSRSNARQDGSAREAGRQAGHSIPLSKPAGSIGSGARRLPS